MSPITVSVNQASTLLGVGRTKLYELINDGSLPIIKIGRRTLIKMDGITAFVATQSRPVA